MNRLRLAATVAAGLMASVAIHSTAMAADGFYLATDGTTVGLVVMPATGTPSYTKYTLTAAEGLPTGTTLIGLGEIGQTLYADTSTGHLYTLTIPTALPNVTTTALPTAVSDGAGLVSGFTLIDMGSAGTGSAETLYALGSNGNIYSVATNGAITQVGTGSDTTGLGASLSRAVGTTTAIGMSTDASLLYLSAPFTTSGAASTAELIYTVNLTTGALTLAGNLGAGTASSIPVGGISEIGGALYGGCNKGCGSGSHNATFTFNGSPPSLTAGTLTDVGPNPTKPLFFGLARVVPEPSNWLLMLLGVGAVGAAARTRRRRVAATA